MIRRELTVWLAYRKLVRAQKMLAADKAKRMIEAEQYTKRRQAMLKFTRGLSA